MKKLLLFAFALLASNLGLKAQTTNYDISKYKLPDTQRKVLDFKFNLNGSNRFSKQYSDYYEELTKDKGSSFGNSINLNYNSFINTRQVQIETYSGLDFTMDYSKSQYERDAYKTNSTNNSLNPYAYYNRAYRKYKSNNTYAEYDINTSLRYSSRTNYYDNESYNRDSKDNELMYSVNAPIKFGKGRIEEVQDARQAIYIMDELHKINRMTDQVAEEDINEFANLIAELKSKRYYDSRLRKINELTVVDSFLHARNLVEENDISYFTTLNDYWSYGRRQIRKSGLRTAFVAYPGFSYLNYLDKETVDFKDDITETEKEETKAALTSISINTGMELNYEKPRSLKTQVGTDFALMFGWLQGTEKDSDEKLRIPNIQLSFEQRYGYYPNTRTALDWFIGAAATKTFNFSNDDDDMNTIGIEAVSTTISTGIYYNYYITPQFRLNANWRLYYDWKDDKNDMMNFNSYVMLDAHSLNSNISRYNNNSSRFYTDDFYNNFSVSLIYSFF